MIEIRFYRPLWFVKLLWHYNRLLNHLPWRKFMVVATDMYARETESEHLHKDGLSYREAMAEAARMNRGGFQFSWFVVRKQGAPLYKFDPNW
jgi:hypothetical protein